MPDPRGVGSNGCRQAVWPPQSCWPAEVDFVGEPATDLEILLSEESIEMFEDLEFYSWLATQELEGDGDLG